MPAQPICIWRGPACWPALFPPHLDLPFVNETEGAMNVRVLGGCAGVGTWKETLAFAG